MAQSAETRRTLHTHTHTHTGKLLPSIKQIVPICFAISFIIFPNFTFADNITNASTCTNGVLGTYTGPADIEANFDPNTINTTWYSNGTQMTGDGIPGSCTYNAPLTPPTPAPRAGYVFAGWRLIVPACEIPSMLLSMYGNSWGYKNDSSGPLGGAERYADAFHLNEDNTWGAYWSNGDKVTGVAFCSTTNNGKTRGETGDPGTTGGYAAGGMYCWCKATHYTGSGAERCSLSSPVWVFDSIFATSADMAADCANNCAGTCSYRVAQDPNFRLAVLGPYVAQ